MKKITTLFLLSTLIFTLAACSGAMAESVEGVLTSTVVTELVEPTATAVDPQQTPEIAPSPTAVEYHQDDLDYGISSSDMSYIRLEGDSITFKGSGATVSGNIVTVTSAGMYSISGTLNDGQVIVDTQDAETVVLVLNGADITSSTSAPIYVSNAEKTVMTLADGTENYVTDGDSYLFEGAEDEPNAAVFSKDDLTINGNGSLTVNANYNNGIASKDDLKITGGGITVNAVNDGIKGRDSIAVKDGTITINAGGDGMQSNNDIDAEKGYVTIEGGTLDITAGLDGIQAETSLLVSGGDIAITSGGGSIESSSGGGFGGRGMGGNPNKTDESAKGLKAGVDLTITGGDIQISSLDDALHSDVRITINGGDILLASGDDGVHGEDELTINGGVLNVVQSYEGLESVIITINDGAIHLVASDDGINSSSGAGGAAAGGMLGRGRGMFESGDNYLYVNGGYIAIDANGDGIDANGSIDMTGGMVIINGPTADFNGALDYLGAFNITGGFIVAVGSAGMAQAPSMSSTQYSVMQIFPSPQAAGTMIHIETEDGEEILTFVSTKAYQSVVLSSPKLKNGSTYIVYSGGSSTGTVTDGLYSGGKYTAGTEAASFTISSMVTGAGSYGGGFPGGGRRRP
jgi:hypothetical protein